MQKHVNLVDLVKSFPTNIYFQNLASIQKRTSPIKFAHLAEKSKKGSISNLSAKERAARRPRAPRGAALRGRAAAAETLRVQPPPAVRRRGPAPRRRTSRARGPTSAAGRSPPQPRPAEAPALRERDGWQNFGKMLLDFGCIGSDFCKKICVLQHFSKSTRFSS